LPSPSLRELSFSLSLSRSLAQALVCGVRGVGTKEEEEKEEGEK
jgi:hypothetical protein